MEDSADSIAQLQNSQTQSVDFASVVAPKVTMEIHTLSLARGFVPLPVQHPTSVIQPTICAKHLAQLVCLAIQLLGFASKNVQIYILEQMPQPIEYVFRPATLGIGRITPPDSVATISMAAPTVLLQMRQNAYASLQPTVQLTPTH